MRYRYDKEFDGIICTPNCADEWMELIQDIAWNYDNCNSVESLKELIDEMVDAAGWARSCLDAGKIFVDIMEANKSREAAEKERERWKNA